jgi:DNA polymerase III epsilon subunit-like protein
MKMSDRPLAITDLETTGLTTGEHEIIEIGLVVARQDTLEVVDELDIKVRPEHPETGSPAAFARNGYRPEDWQAAVSLESALRAYAAKTAEAMFLAHNVSFDWKFMAAAFEQTGVTHQLDYHRLDLMSGVWFLGPCLPGLRHLNLKALCEHFGVPPEPDVHRAINGARSALAVLRCLRAEINRLANQAGQGRRS